MPQRSKYLFVASMDVEPEREARFNEVYNTEHCPLLSQVPGVISVSRFETQELTMIIGGETRTIVIENEPKHHALYELESPDVLTSSEWGKAVDQGRWPEQVRPYTFHRRHTLLRLTYPEM
jgi:hypothetical protein